MNKKLPKGIGELDWYRLCKKCGRRFKRKSKFNWVCSNCKNKIYGYRRISDE